MKKINMISRVAMTVIAFILFSVMIINEDSSWNFIPIMFSLIVFGLSFPSTIFAKKIIEIGDKIDNKLLKMVYYVILPIILLGICLIVYIIVFNINSNFITTPDEFTGALSQAFLLLFIVAVMVVVIILPYVQAIIINILKKIIK